MKSVLLATLCTCAATASTLPLIRLRGGDHELLLRSGDLELVKMYMDLCLLYQTKPHPSVMTALRHGLTHIHPTKVNGVFRDVDLLPLCDLLALPTASHITSLSFHKCRIRSAGGLQLARLMVRMPQLEVLDVSGNVLGAEAGAHIADALASSPSLRELKLRSCRLRAAGTDALSLAIASGEPSRLRVLDLSNNRVGFRSKAAIERVNARRTRPLALELAGNLVLTETLNVLSHGVGTMLAVFGSAALMNLVRHASPPLQAACAVYAASLLLCYLSSTVFHAAFPLVGGARHIFHILDQCAIYLLIAGSYTPFMVALFPNKRAWSVGIVAYEWALCAIGVAIELIFHKARLPPLIRDMRRTMDPSAFRMLLGGGLAYTLGVPVFVRNRNLDHVVWHAFVLAGSAMHFGAVWSTVAAALQGTL